MLFLFHNAIQLCVEKNWMLFEHLIQVCFHQGFMPNLWRNITRLTDECAQHVWRKNFLSVVFTKFVFIHRKKMLRVCDGVHEWRVRIQYAWWKI